MALLETCLLTPSQTAVSPGLASTCSPDFRILPPSLIG